ncbi:unnamed protein product [Blumeria hordei]|uniref:Charged multivesicular body protein 6 n=1 Tax=Blumeria hordei TaxID=2867405 RepID=A0A383UW87_BLUHO|nr:unnamed protein product [Blumeria hordei]
MGNSPSRRKISAQDKAILDMKNQRDKLHQYQRRITILTDKEREIAKEMLAQGNRSKAQLALRRKKYQESLLAKTDAQLEQLEKLTNSVEFALIQKDVIYGLEQGTNVLKSIHREIGGIDHVEKLMGDTAEAIAYQEEISDMLGGQMTNQDEDEVEDELSALEVELNSKIAMPSVPATSLPVKYDKKRQQESAEPIAMLT